MVKLNKIYTRTGDAGDTGLADGNRRSKSDPRIQAYGTVDEANSAVGLARLHTKGEADSMLKRIQNELFDLGADLATPGENFEPTEMTLRMVKSQVERLEDEIDAMNSKLESLTSFLLPGGQPSAAYLHMARTIIRRAEREMVAMQREEAVNPVALQYVNRLSDHLFVLARLENSKNGGDVLWEPGATRG